MERQRRECRGAADAEVGGVWGGEGVSPLPTGEGSGEASPEIFLHFHVEMAHYNGGIVAVNFKFYSMNKTVKVHQNPTNTCEYEYTMP